MTQDEIIEMWIQSNQDIYVFAELAAAKVEEVLTEQHMTDIHQAIKIEREEIASFVEDLDERGFKELAGLIRARGEK